MQEKLAKRKFKSPNPIIHGIYHFIMKYFVMRKYKLKITRRDKISDCKGPCFIIFNHLSRYDHMFVMRAAWPRRYNMLAAYNELLAENARIPELEEALVEAGNTIATLTEQISQSRDIILDYYYQYTGNQGTLEEALAYFEQINNTQSNGPGSSNADPEAPSYGR